jgi:hypothetical protein
MSDRHALGRTYEAPEPRQNAIAPVLARLIGWVETQFRELGRRDARDLANALVASYEGLVLIASSLGKPELIATEVKRLERWIEALSYDGRSGRHLSCCLPMVGGVASKAQITDAANRLVERNAWSRTELKRFRGPRDTWRYAQSSSRFRRHDCTSTRDVEPVPRRGAG